MRSGENGDTDLNPLHAVENHPLLVKKIHWSDFGKCRSAGVISECARVGFGGSLRRDTNRLSFHPGREGKPLATTRFGR
jgi:hypothetical protein